MSQLGSKISNLELSMLSKKKNTIDENINPVEYQMVQVKSQGFTR
jgi:hypothetical protein